MIMGPDGTLYEGGFFKARLVFPSDFPNMPPTMTFTSEMWHPNVYADGKVCISILHPPGEDEFNSQESADERWRPILGVEQILISVISMLSDPNDESPANLDAAVMWRNDRQAFKKKVRQVVRKSQEECWFDSFSHPFRRFRLVIGVWSNQLLVVRSSFYNCWHPFVYVLDAQFQLCHCYHWINIDWDRTNNKIE